ncbi:hypothetical protein HUJ04_003086 [Dendroctonus ponderosae]|nr:hypothetical protein HUJ04_003086 [Dendroctonus ponderosae]
MDTLRIAQRRIERVCWKYDCEIEKVARLKVKWEGHLMRTEDNRWSRKVTEWRPRGCRRNPGRLGGRRYPESRGSEMEE